MANSIPENEGAKGNNYSKSAQAEKGMKVENRLGGENIEQELDRLKEDMATLASSLKTIASNAASIAVESLRDRFDQASGDVQSAVSNSRVTAQRTVEEHPLATVLLALGLGFLIGQWMRR